MAEMENRWLSVDEIGKYLGVSSDTVYRWIDKQSMPAHRMGRLWKFKRDQVDAWIEAGGAKMAGPANKRISRDHDGK
jgi:excisionase family DNA binding protein